MAKVTVRVDRDPAKQPPWARKFLDSLSFERNPVIHMDFSGLMSLGPRRDSHREWAKKVIKDNQPFTPPVTLLYTSKHYWSFSWANEAEQTMFRLKWS